MSIALCLSFILFACSTDESVEEFTNLNDDSKHGMVQQTHLFRDVSYGNLSQQTYDIYLPEIRSYTSTKVLILVHGGGWMAGDKSTLHHYIESLQQTNPEYAIVNMNYITATPGDHHAFPGQFHDIKSVINSIKQNKFTFQVKPEFGLIGASAGGHLTLMYDYVFDQDDDVKFVCSIAGPTNFDHPFYTERPDFFQLMDILVDDTVYPNIQNNLDLLSPLAQVSNRTSPTILFYGSNDIKVPVDNAYDLRNSLTHHGISNSLTVFDEGHGNWSEENRKILDEMLSGFIYKQLPL